MTYTIEQLEKMLAATTTGPWVVRDFLSWLCVDRDETGETIAEIGSNVSAKQDAALIAAAPTIATAHIDALKRIAELEAALGKLVGAFEKLNNVLDRQMRNRIPLHVFVEVAECLDAADVALAGGK